MSASSVSGRRANPAANALRRASGSLTLAHTSERLIQTEPGATGAKLLVVCNAYPSAAALYRNGFIHRRVKGYIDAGYQVDVFYNHEPAKTPYDYVYEGVAVRVGDQNALRNLLSTADYSAYLVHFAEPSRVDPLLEDGGGKPIIVWIHGFEAEAWHRRWFNFIGSPTATREALKKRNTYYHSQNAFLRELIENDASHDLSFVNVSEWFKRFIVEPDIGVEFGENSVVIPNLVDERLFPHREKSTADRLKLLSIRPFASRKYANDITVGAIKLLSSRPYFNDLSFTICGEGPLFDETTAPIKGLDNVTLINEFLSQDEIAAMHARHGVFLAPTRFDSQGVSMCEAMSSGLVALATDIAAIPEYVRHGETGLLSTPESAESLADNIERLYFDEELFMRVSEQGSKWMTNACGFDATVGREVDLISQKVN